MSNSTKHTQARVQIFLRIRVARAHVENQFTDWFVSRVLAYPPGIEGMFSFDDYGNDRREIWQIPEIRKFIKKALSENSEVLLRFSKPYQELLRSCVCEVVVSRKGFQLLLSTPKWEKIAAAAGLNFEE